jgi:hypothetical protein
MYRSERPSNPSNRSRSESPRWACRWLATLSLLFMLASAAGVHAADDPDQALSDAKKALESAFARNDGKAMAAAVQDIAKVGTTDAIETLCKLEVLGPREAYLATASELDKVKDPELLKVLTDAYAKADKRNRWQRQVMMLDALADDVDGPATETFRAAIKDKHPKVRLAAIRALGSAKDPKRIHVELLIESLLRSEMRKDVGTPHLEAREALARITGKKILKHEDWVAWFRGKEDFVPLKQGPAEKRVEPDDIKTYDDEDLTYYDEPVTSRRLLFIIDTSGSMTAPIKVKTTTSSGGEHVENTTRMESAKNELIQLLKQLPAYTGFNLMQFDSDVESWKKSMVGWSRANINSAAKFTKDLQPGGSTAANQALTEALQNNLSVDSIYILTDGGPSDAQVADILVNVEKLNRFARIKIHTVGIGSSAEAMLKPLAEQNNGVYKQVD